jgi:glycosyltransferase involved in cell wall biosynthesis
MDRVAFSRPLFLTILTPTYNRAHTLHRVHDSLLIQAMGDFEWIVIDDGSTDGTADVVGAWAKSAPFAIRYLRKPNGGKHTAVNLGLEHARGEFATIIDSDDSLAPDALSTIAECEAAATAAGGSEIDVMGFLSRDDLTGAVCGDRFPVDGAVSTYTNLMHRHSLRGEWQFVVRTALLRRYPQPELIDSDGNPIRTKESVVWRRISRDSKFRLWNRIIRIYYTNDGEARLTTAQAPQARRLRGFISGYFAISEEMYLAFHDPAYLIHSSFRYIKYGCLSGIGIREQISAVRPLLAKLLCLAVLPRARRKTRRAARAIAGLQPPVVSASDLRANHEAYRSARRAWRAKP